MCVISERMALNKLFMAAYIWKSIFPSIFCVTICLQYLNQQLVLGFFYILASMKKLLVKMGCDDTKYFAVDILSNESPGGMGIGRLQRGNVGKDHCYC